MWNATKAITYLNSHGRVRSTGRCAEFVRKAIEAGGVVLVRHTSAKDYGSSLESVRFSAMPGKTSLYQAGDVAIVEPIPGHPHGHMAMYNGAIWISDFRQIHGVYPGPAYRSLKPAVKIYRYTAPPGMLSPGVDYAPGSTRFA